MNKTFLSQARVTLRHIVLPTVPDGFLGVITGQASFLLVWILDYFTFRKSGTEDVTRQNTHECARHLDICGSEYC